MKKWSAWSQKDPADGKCQHRPRHLASTQMCTCHPLRLFLSVCLSVTVSVLVCLFVLLVPRFLRLSLHSATPLAELRCNDRPLLLAAHAAIASSGCKIFSKCRVRSSVDSVPVVDRRAALQHTARVVHVCQTRRKSWNRRQEEVSNMQ